MAVENDRVLKWNAQAPTHVNRELAQLTQSYTHVIFFFKTRVNLVSLAIFLGLDELEGIVSQAQFGNEEQMKPIE